MDCSQIESLLLPPVMAWTRTCVLDSLHFTIYASAVFDCDFACWTRAALRQRPPNRIGLTLCGFDFIETKYASIILCLAVVMVFAHIMKTHIIRFRAMCHCCHIVIV